MTNSGMNKQGEGCRERGFPLSMLSPEHWTRQPVWAEQCIRVEVVVHQLPDRSVACWAYEASNPHNKELLAKHVQPYASPTQGQTLANEIGEAVELALIALLDPDPF